MDAHLRELERRAASGEDVRVPLGKAWLRSGKRSGWLWCSACKHTGKKSWDGGGNVPYDAVRRPPCYHCNGTGYASFLDAMKVAAVLGDPFAREVLEDPKLRWCPECGDSDFDAGCWDEQTDRLYCGTCGRGQEEHDLKLTPQDWNGTPGRNLSHWFMFVCSLSEHHVPIAMAEAAMHLVVNNELCTCGIESWERRLLARFHAETCSYYLSVEAGLAIADYLRDPSREHRNTCERLGYAGTYLGLGTVQFIAGTRTGPAVDIIGAAEYSTEHTVRTAIRDCLVPLLWKVA